MLSSFFSVVNILCFCCFYSLFLSPLSITLTPSITSKKNDLTTEEKEALKTECCAKRKAMGLWKKIFRNDHQAVCTFEFHLAFFSCFSSVPSFSSVVNIFCFCCFYSLFTISITPINNTDPIDHKQKKRSHHRGKRGFENRVLRKKKSDGIMKKNI